MIIYKTTNKINDKFYIGKDENNNEKYLGSGIHLIRAIKKYGRKNFIKEILEECSSREDLNEREIFWIKKLNAIKMGYNLAEGGTGGKTQKNAWNKGLTKDTNDIVKRIGEKNRQHLLGSIQSEETKRKRAEKRIGKKCSKETKEKMSIARRGRSLSEETKEKIRFSIKNYMTAEKRKEISVRQTGRILSEQHKQKISASLRKRMANYKKAIEELDSYGKTKMTLFGKSMFPIIKSGSTIEFEKQEEYNVGDIVFCRVKNHYIGVHLIIKKNLQKGYLIANNQGWENGWTKKIYGKVVGIN